MHITAISLDWGDTLAANHGQPYRYNHRRALEALAAALAALGGSPETSWVDDLHQAWHAEWAGSADPRHNPEHREYDQLGIFLAAIRRTGLEPDAPAVAAALDGFSARCLETVIAFDGIGEVLAELKARGYRIGITSHVPWHRPACEAWYRRRGWHEHIDFWSLSSEVGWIKPHPAHFQHAIAAAGCPPEEILHVGDHPLRDVCGAREHGMRTCLRHTDGIYPIDQLAGCAPDLEIGHLRDLLTQLE